jgi:hypothetical protein
MLPSRLLRDPLPDPLPSSGSGRFRWLRDLRASLAASMTAPPLSAEGLVDRRVRRGAMQALVREAYDATVAEQDDAHRKPAEFVEAWLGRRALDQLEGRHPDLIWYTTGQFKDAPGFYDRYRQHSDSPWTDRQHPCPHFD